MLWRAENWMLSTQKFVKRNKYGEGFLCDNPGLARLLCVNIYQDSQTQWSTLRYVD